VNRGGLLRGLAPLAPLLLFLLVFFLYPVARMLWLSVAGAASPLARYHELWATPLYRHVLAETFRLSLGVTAACLLLGYPVAYTLAVAPVRRASLLLVLVITPFWISVLARSFTWMVLLQRGGVINQALLALHLIRTPVPLVYNLLGVYIGMIHILLPFMILSLYAVMRGIDPALLRAAANLGATEWQAFRRVFLPLSLPGVAAGSLMLFVVGLGFFITPALLGGGKVTTVAMLIEAYIHEALDWGLASALACVLMLATVVVLVVYHRVLNLDRMLHTA
jgi:ABC-type spermidine/putrescine transport system permease subunit I